MKKFIVGLLTLGLMLTGCSSSSSSDESSEVDLSEAKIGVIQLMQHNALDASYEGFKEVLLDAGVSEDNINYQVAGDESNCATVADSLVNGGNNLIYAIGTPALQAVAAATDELPIVGCAITDYESTNLIDSDEKPGGNITGASDLTPVAEQFDLMMELLPDTKSVAIMYCGSEDNSIIQGEIAVEAAENLGLEYQIYTVTDSNDIQSVGEKIVADGQDVVYIPTDNLLATYMSSVEAITTPAGIPVIVGEEGMVENGGFATYGINYTNLGTLAGEQAVAILNGEATPADTPIAYLSADECQMVVNLRVAQDCGIEIDQDAYEDASFIEE